MGAFAEAVKLPIFQFAVSFLVAAIPAAIYEALLRRAVSREPGTPQRRRAVIITLACAAAATLGVAVWGVVGTVTWWGGWLAYGAIAGTLVLGFHLLFGARALGRELRGDRPVARSRDELFPF
ncbi:hypothetical protein Q6346_14795 [Isoptericola sp. b490]|uniref:hypothetical protein n=1 Tax=Actinotalea lenta TaxID=3064654 RepID=UPI002712C366|nr:hypothetical protein [Isoptericola sp. b490]MDO8122576.1 hypothetical protein [Isoptericola sp. b490]